MNDTIRMDRRNDPAEPLPLVRAPSLRESWFDAKPEPVASFASESAVIDVRESRTSYATPAPRNSTLLCGGFVGLVAAAAMLITAMLTSHVDVARVLGMALTKGSTGSESAVGIGALMAFGLVFGAVFARATRHVQRMVPVAIFGVIFAPIAWLAMHVFVLARFASGVAAALPLGGLVMGAAVAGVVLSLVVPLRGGATPVRRARVSIA